MLSEFLKVCVGRYTEGEERAARLLTPLTTAQANWKPEPKKWSVNECIEHLNISSGSYLACMAPAVDRARAGGVNGTEPYSKGTIAGRVILSVLRAGPKRRAPAPGVFRPTASDRDKDSLLKRFLEISRGLRELADHADGLKLGHIRFGTPVSMFVRVSLAQAFEIHALHHQRHLDQVERVLAHEGFPEA